MLFDWFASHFWIIILYFTCGVVANITLSKFIDSTFKISEIVELEKDMLEYLKLIAEKENKVVRENWNTAFSENKKENDKNWRDAIKGVENK